MDFLDQAVDVRGHHQQVPGRGWLRIPIAVGSPAGNQDPRACSSLELAIANANAERSFQYVPGFIICEVNMKRGNQPWRSWRGAGITPFGNDKIVFRGTENLTSKGRSDHRRRHVAGL